MVKPGFPLKLPDSASNAMTPFIVAVSVFILETVNGLLIGAGFESDMADNMFVRGEVSFTDYDDVSLRSSVKRTGVTSANLIEADLDVTMFKASIGYKF